MKYQRKQSVLWQQLTHWLSQALDKKLCRWHLFWVIPQATVSSLMFMENIIKVDSLPTACRLRTRRPQGVPSPARGRSPTCATAAGGSRRRKHAGAAGRADPPANSQDIPLAHAAHKPTGTGRTPGLPEPCPQYSQPQCKASAPADTQRSRIAVVFQREKAGGKELAGCALAQNEPQDLFPECCVAGP